MRIGNRFKGIGGVSRDRESRKYYIRYHQTEAITGNKILIMTETLPVAAVITGAPSKDLTRVSRFNRRVLNLLNEMAKLLERSQKQKEALMSEGKQEEKGVLGLRIGELVKAKGEVEKFVEVMRSALPSDTRMMKTFARDVYQPYEQCNLLQNWGYSLVAGDLTERSKEDLEAYVYKTSEIARGDECISLASSVATTGKVKAVKEEKAIGETEKRVSEEAEGEPYRSQAEAAVVSVEDWLEELQTLLLFGQPTEEEAAAFLHSKLRGLASSFSRRAKKANIDKLVEVGIAGGDHGSSIVSRIFPRIRSEKKSVDDASITEKGAQQDPDRRRRLLKGLAHKAKKAGSNAVKLVPPKKSILRVIRTARALLRLLHGLVRGNTCAGVLTMRQPLRRLLQSGFGVAASAEAEGLVKALTGDLLRNSIMGKHLSGITGEVMSYFGLGPLN